MKQYKDTDYYVTEDGKVWSEKRKMWMKPQLHNRGYLQFSCWHNGKRKNVRIHRAMMETFMPVQGMEDLVVDHMDGDKTNNVISNLVWTTDRENLERSYKQHTLVSPDGVEHTFQNANQFAREHGIGRGIHYLLQGKFKSAKGWTLPKN
ncbi:HNH endonuclease [Vibrio harveyi]|uniref:HNH endonuclease n=1 Tax=Vibrio harveyi TaxID=669 RepID=UPI0018F278D3|nr:HNH endonuclease [Vibrio harveyi]